MSFFVWNKIQIRAKKRKLSTLKNGGRPSLSNKPKRRTSVAHVGRSVTTEKPQRARRVSFSHERVRVRGRSPAFNALAFTFENPSARNLSTSPPQVKKPYPKSDSSNGASWSTAIASLTATFEQPPREPLMPDPSNVHHTFATAGSDGAFNFWDKHSKQRLKAMSI